MGYQLDVVQGQAAGWQFGPAVDDGVSLAMTNVRAQVRAAPGRPLIVNLTATLSSDLLTFVLSLTGAQAAAIPAGDYVWDVIANLNGAPIRLADGRFSVRASVTV